MYVYMNTVLEFTVNLPFMAERLLYVGYCQLLTFQNSTLCSLCICFICISEQTAYFALYSIQCLVFVTEKKSVYCAVRTGYLKYNELRFVLKGF
jgi:hypothetical protein